jgi:16S rRNA (uracil1498-N3)-methyltransferase
MRTTLIYTRALLDSHATFVLEPESSHHLARVLRLGVGDTLTVFDGRGGEYPGEITAVDKKHVHLRTGAHLPRECESPLSIHLGIAVSRGERMDWIVQKSTELGVTALTPLVTEHNGVKLDAERAAKKIQHWQQIAISACEQCGRNRLPAVHTMQSLQQWLAETEAERKYVLHHRAERAGLSSVAGAVPESVALLVGPEGGLSEAEISAAKQAGYSALRLGPRVLRTETAPLAAIAVLQAYWGDMRPG